mgnify:CR=1 FL=1
MGGRVDEPTGGECQAKPAPTIWKIPDDVWEIAVEILDREYPKRVKGHRRVDLRPIVNGILYRLRTGCQWNHLPKAFGDDSTIHRPFQAMCVRESVGSVGREVRRTRRRRLGMAGRRRLDGEGARKVSDGSRCGWQEPHRPRKIGVKWSLLVERTGSPEEADRVRAHFPIIVIMTSDFGSPLPSAPPQAPYVVDYPAEMGAETRRIATMGNPQDVPARPRASN